MFADRVGFAARSPELWPPIPGTRSMASTLGDAIVPLAVGKLYKF
jgi:hypothetical protein